MAIFRHFMRALLIAAFLSATSPYLIIVPAHAQQSAIDEYNRQIGEPRNQRGRMPTPGEIDKEIGDIASDTIADMILSPAGVVVLIGGALFLLPSSVLTSPALVLAGLVLLLAAIARGEDSVPSQNIRPLDLADLPTSFSGVANGAIPYSGTRNGSSISGTYPTGAFGGTLNSSLRVFGRWRDVDSSAGVFSGRVTPSLDQAFGSGSCTTNCD